MSEMHSYLVADGHGLRHDPFGSLVAPRPIGWISSMSKNGALNLAPYSFFNAFSYKPPIIGFASVGWKDTAQNIEETGEFVWNLASVNQASAVNATSENVPHGQSEFDLTRLPTAASSLIDVPRVATALAAMECRHTQSIRLKDRSGGDVDSWLILGEVIAVHVSHHLIADNMVRTELAQPLLRGGGKDYFTLDILSKFTLDRPTS